MELINHPHFPVWILLSFLVGGGLAWAIRSLLARSQTLQALAELQSQNATVTAQAQQRQHQIDSLVLDNTTLRENLRQLEKAKIAAETTLACSEEHFAKQHHFLNEAQASLSDTFRSLASEALAGSNQGFLTLAEEKFKALKDEAAVELLSRQTAIETLIQPLNESLQRYQHEAKELEDKRLRELSAVSEQLRQLASTQTNLQMETSKLVNALRSPHIRGRWGEIALRKTAELSGMSAHCDFSEQVSATADTGRLRPDMIVKLPGGREVVVDSKVPLHGFLESLESQTEEARMAALTRHAAHVRTHVNTLASKEYWEQFPAAPEFVVLFIPNDSFLAAAAEQDSSLVEKALQKNVVLATPTTFIALLRAIAHGWRQEQVAKGAHRISALGQEMADRMGTLVEHFSKVGTSLSRTVESYNATVASLENRVLPSARKFKQLGVNTRKDIPELRSVEPIINTSVSPPESLDPPSSSL